jgi:VanZ family protein
VALTKVSSLLFSLCWLSLITFLLCLPGSDLPQESWFGDLPIDKIVHVFLFTVLYAGWYYWTGFQYPEWSQAGRAVLVCISGLVYGIGMEFVQKYFVPQRSFDVADMIADAGGLLLGLFICYLLLKKKKPL